MSATCFRCQLAPGTMVHTFDRSRGFFLIGAEPRTCESCTDEIRIMSDDERAVVFAGFEAQPDSPSGGADIFEDMQRRERELKNRGQA